MTNRPTLRSRIAGHLVRYPDRTSQQIAAAIGADHFDVQSTVCRMLLDDLLLPTGHRPAAGRSWPTYRFAAHPETANG